MGIAFANPGLSLLVQLASGGPSSSGMSRQHSNMASDLQSRREGKTERKETIPPCWLQMSGYSKQREGRRLPATTEQVPVYCTATHPEPLEPAAAAAIARHTGSAALSAALSPLRLASACPAWTWYGLVWHFLESLTAMDDGSISFMEWYEADVL